MIEISNVSVYGWDASIRGMRNPMNSWYLSDTVYEYVIPSIGENDMILMQKLAKGGSDDRKYLRFITVSVDINAPLYWWKEFDTYRIGVEKNSCSTMHKIHAKEFTLDDFSHEHIDDTNLLWMIPEELNKWRNLFIETKDKKYWWQMIQLLPSSYNQKRTALLNYEALYNMYCARRIHKLDEWVEFCKWIEALPYFKEIFQISEVR